MSRVTWFNKKRALRHFGLRLREDQANFLESLPNASLFVREAIDLALSLRRNEMLDRCRSDFFGRSHENHQSFASPFGHVLVMSLPPEVWSDDAIRAKLDAGESLDDVIKFLRSRLHPFFTQGLQSHVPNRTGKMWEPSRESTQGPEKKLGILSPTGGS